MVVSASSSVSGILVSPTKLFSSTNLGVLSQAREASEMPRTCVNTFAARAGVMRTFIIYPRLIIDLFFPPSCYLLCRQSGDDHMDIVKIQNTNKAIKRKTQKFNLEILFIKIKSKVPSHVILSDGFNESTSPSTKAHPRRFNTRHGASVT